MIIKLLVSLGLIIGAYYWFIEFIFSRGTIMAPKAVILLASLLILVLSLIIIVIFSI